MHSENIRLNKILSTGQWLDLVSIEHNDMRWILQVPGTGHTELHHNFFPFENGEDYRN